MDRVEELLGKRRWNKHCLRANIAKPEDIVCYGKEGSIKVAKVASNVLNNREKEPELYDAIKAVATTDAVAALTPFVRSWEAYTFNIPGLGAMHFNATVVIGAALMLIIFAIPHRGIASTASAQKVLAIIVLVPLLLVGLVPIFTGAIQTANVTALVPPTAGYSGVDAAGWTLGGGFGLLGRYLGLGCDSVLEMEVVLSNGTVVTANSSESEPYSGTRGQAMRCCGRGEVEMSLPCAPGPPCRGMGRWEGAERGAASGTGDALCSWGVRRLPLPHAPCAGRSRQAAATT